MNYVEEAKELVRNLDQRMGPSPYDIAWMARLRTEDSEPRWPDLINWLVEHQHPDGSWGSEIEYYHDRVICTLVAIIALRESGGSSQTERAIERGERYLWHHIHLLPRDPFELVGFELILPTLLGEAQDLGLDVPTHTCGYGEIQTAKIRLIPPDKLYSPHISTVYSLEFLGRDGDPDRLRYALTNNGSLGNSPAATAYYLRLDGHNADALEYLERVRAHMEHIIPVYPFRTFELTWVLNNFTFSGSPLTDFADKGIWEKLKNQLGPSGVGFDPTFGIPDGDTTSACCRVLLEAGYNVNPAILKQFEDKEKKIIRTYHYERNVSVSTNVHALDALSLMPDYPDRNQVKEQIILMLLNSRKYNMYWTDKWHASPYYATSHALTALIREGSSLAYAYRNTVDWLLHTQNEDGSWGFFGTGTVEETAYVLSALLHYHRVESVDEDVFHRSASYLARMYREADMTYPRLWIVKCLYAPYDIIRSAILATLILYENTFARGL
jgi:halimadienyl-diphosphate synthase